MLYEVFNFLNTFYTREKHKNRDKNENYYAYKIMTLLSHDNHEKHQHTCLTCSITCRSNM